MHMGAMETKAPMAPNCASSGRKGGREGGEKEDYREREEKNFFQNDSRKANNHNLE